VCCEMFFPETQLQCSFCEREFQETVLRDGREGKGFVYCFFLAENNALKCILYTAWMAAACYICLTAQLMFVIRRCFRKDQARQVVCLRRPYPDALCPPLDIPL